MRARKQIKIKLIYHVAVCWLSCMQLRGWAQCKARWRSNRQQDGAAALMKSVNIATMTTWEINIIRAG
jgi:hypothetical protein